MADISPGPGDGGERRGARELGLDALRFLDDPLHVELPAEPHDAAKRLLAFLGVTWEVVVPMTPSPIKAKLDAEREAQTLKPATGDTATLASSGGLKAEEMTRRHQVFLDAQEMTARCSIDDCDWRFHGTAGEGKRLAAEHRADAHPGVRTLTKAERKNREIKEARRLRDERDAGQVTDRNQRALERMDAHPASSPSPLLKHTEESIIAAVQAYAAEHDGHAPSGSKAPFAAMAFAAKKRYDLTWRQISEKAGVLPALMGSAAHRKPLDAEAAQQPASASSGPGVDEKVLTSSGEGPALSRGAPDEPDGLSAETSGSSPELGRDPDGSGDSRASAPPDLGPEDDDPELPGDIDPPEGGALDLVEPSRAEPSRALPAHRDPIRTADIPYDIHLLQDEAAYLRERANALEQIAAGLHRLQQLTTVKETT